MWEPRGSPKYLCCFTALACAQSLRLGFPFGLRLGGELLLYLGNRVGVHLINRGCLAESVRSVLRPVARTTVTSTSRRESAPSSARRRKAVNSLSSKSVSRSLRIPCCRASVCNCHSFRSGTVCFRTNNKYLFMSRTGTASPMAFNTRMPVVLALACSLTLLLLFCLPFHVVAILLLLRMVHRAGRIGADLVNGADIATLGDDGVRRELANLELGTLGLFLRFGFFVADSGVLVSRQDLAAFLLLAVGAADLHKLRLRCDLLGDVFANPGLIAAWISALCGIWANRKSFLLAPRRHASQSGRYPVRIRAALYGRLRHPTSDSAC